MLRKAAFLLKPELAHKCTLKLLKYNCLPRQQEVVHRSLQTETFGLKFINPIGLAAGFDKNSECITQLAKQGFGFIEIGTVTPKKQYGNAKPRVFRLTADKAVINCIGFSNKGVGYLKKQVKCRQDTLHNCILGINIGKNKNSKGIDDYSFLLREVYDISKYIVINISSPNTPNLRDLHNKRLLDELLSSLLETRKNIDHTMSVPLLLKISPDISDSVKHDIATLVIQKEINGLIIANTTIGSRDNLLSKHRLQYGGLSGQPLKQLTTILISEIYSMVNKKIPIIGCGGISNGHDAYEKIKAGASLVQLYTAIIYNGFSLINSIKRELITLLHADGFDNISEAVGIEY